ncbi:endonuclease V isoform X3 [Rhea pennata]|uniref:endonuclease V isoform X3 n=1 Tax=Rhea pennata TaxID=8795 RepID=UPI002E2733B8
MSEPPAGAALRRWAREQARLKASVIEEDTEEWQKDPSFAGLERVGGVDLSYVKGDDTKACASLVVLSYPDLEVLYEDCQMVAVTAPYVAGFLAFREVPFLVEAVQRLQQKELRLKPQVLLVDGNGLLHHRDSFPANGRRCIPTNRYFRESPGHDEKRRLNLMIKLMPEETAGPPYTESSRLPRVWVCEVQQPSAALGKPIPVQCRATSVRTMSASVWGSGGQANLPLFKDNVYNIFV